MIAALFFMYLQLRQHWAGLVFHPEKTSFPQFLFAIGLILIMLAGMFLGWHLALRSVGIVIPFRVEFQIYFQTNILRYIPGSLWNFSGRAYYVKKYGISLTAFSQGEFLELFFLIGMGFIFSFQGLSIRFQSSLLSYGSAVIIVCMVLTILFPEFILSIGGRINLITNRINKRYLILLVINYFLIWILYGTAIEMLLGSLYGVSFSLWQVVCYNALSWSTGFLSLAPAGFGVREYSLSTLFGQKYGAQVIIASLFERSIELLGDFILWVVAKLPFSYVSSKIE